MGNRRVQWAAAITAVGVLLGSAGGVWARTISHWNGPTSKQSLCADYQSFAGAILGRGALADAGLRMTVARLQHSAARYATSRQPGSTTVKDSASALRLLINAPYASRTDLFVAARPVAIVCELDWRNGSLWEYAPGS